MGKSATVNLFYGWTVSFEKLQENYELVKKYIDFEGREDLDNDDDIGEAIDEDLWSFTVGTHTYRIISLNGCGCRQISCDYAIGIPFDHNEGIEDDEMLQIFVEKNLLPEYDSLRSVMETLSPGQRSKTQCDEHLCNNKKQP